jgi:type I restriction enzyme S subunit
MIEGFNPYPAYKDSGVRWLGEVPAHWTVLRQRNAVDMRVSNVDKHSKEGELAVRLCNYVDVYKNDRIGERMPFMRASATREEIDRFRLQTGDVLITKDSETWNDIGVPALVECSAPDLICGYHLALLRPREGLMDGTFLLRVQQSLPVAYQYHISASGVTRYGLSHDAIKSVFLPCPPLPEQAAIVRFLDHADRQIQRYIRAKRKLIKLLEEQKQAIIHHAVTRGLDLNARLKPSGVAWLGEVPEHWAVRRLKYVSPEITVGVVVNPSSYFVEIGVPMLLGNNVLPGRFKLDNVRRITPDSNHVLGKSQLHAGDVVVVRVGAPGVAAVVSDELDGCNCASMVIVRRGREVEPRWIEHLFNCPVMRRQIDVVKYGAAQKQFNISHAVEFWTLVPGMEEQRKILEYLSRELASQELTVDRVTSEISLLREYRTRLIADVVTGKLDVREAAATLPDEADEGEVPDHAAVADTDEAAGDADLDAVLEENEA